MTTVNLPAPLFRNLAQGRHGVFFMVAGPLPVRKALSQLALALGHPDEPDHNDRLVFLKDPPGRGPFRGPQIVPTDLEPNDFTLPLVWFDDPTEAPWLADGLRSSRSLCRAVIAVVTREVLDHELIAPFRTDKNVLEVF
ncbi:hypothetical protein [Ornithinimicrobium murale]|uniref:hypothetical protein n=1 Tax=Ornithinimicrobium murale TaxID=1050153 RepID=UPI000E0D5F24|nr:hypothetical protein [Ornithinimicrobium murale]